MKNKKGFLSIIDGILAITIVLMCFIIFNSIISISDSSYSDSVHDFKTSQDIMEALSSKINYTDSSILEKTSYILESGNNSKESIKKASIYINASFNELELNNNFLFVETKKLGGKTILSSGNFENADNYTVASRNCGNYSYTLYIW